MLFIKWKRILNFNSSIFIVLKVEAELSTSTFLTVVSESLNCVFVAFFRSFFFIQIWTVPYSTLDTRTSIKTDSIRLHIQRSYLQTYLWYQSQKILAIRLMTIKFCYHKLLFEEALPETLLFFVAALNVLRKMSALAM